MYTTTLDLDMRKKLVKCYIWSIALYGNETWTIQTVAKFRNVVLEDGKDQLDQLCEK